MAHSYANTSQVDQSDPKDEFLEELNPLNLDIDDKTLVDNIDTRIKRSKDFYVIKDLKDRQERNKAYLFGEQFQGIRWKKYNARYMDNLHYEGMWTIKPIAMSRLPDMIVKPGNNTQESKNTAEDITKVVNSDLRKRENRKTLGLAFIHRPVYFTGVMKAVWDPTTGDSGDYRFKNVFPQNIIVDHTATTNDTRDMSFISEYVELSIKEVTMRFPKKAKEFLELVKISKFGGNDLTEAAMASPVNIVETWFKWPEEVTDPASGEKKWEMVYGTAWKYKTLLLDKMRNPYWDWQGERRLFKYESGEERRALSQEELRRNILGVEDNVASDQFYFNHSQLRHLEGFPSTLCFINSAS